jgi:hypothetical protein
MISAALWKPPSGPRKRSPAALWESGHGADRKAGWLASSRQETVYHSRGFLLNCYPTAKNLSVYDGRSLCGHILAWRTEALLGLYCRRALPRSILYTQGGGASPWRGLRRTLHLSRWGVL